MSMKPNNKAPKGIINQITLLFIEGCSKEHISGVTGLPECKISDIIDDLNSTEFSNLLSYNLVKIGQNGEDLSDLLEINQGREILIQQGVLAKDAPELLTDILEFRHEISLDPDIFLLLFKKYCKVALGGVKTSEDFKIKLVKVLDGYIFLTEEVKTLQWEYESLRGKKK